jgi:hypothetical protein
MLEHDTVDADGVLTRVPLSFAYANAWASVLNYKLLAGSDQRLIFRGPQDVPHPHYYEAELTADTGSVRASSRAWRFTVYLMEDPFGGRASACVGMWGQPIDEDLFQDLMLSTSRLPYSALVAEKLIEKSDWLEHNPMYRGLPGVAAIGTPSQSADDPPRPRDWS